MPENMNLVQAAEFVHLSVNDLKHVAQRGEIEAHEHGGDWHFRRGALEEWAQRSLLAASRRELKSIHRDMLDEHRREAGGTFSLVSLFHPEAIDLALTAKAKAGLIRDMTDLAEQSTLLYDPEALFKELMAREEAASTAVGRGIALLHPRFRDPYMFAESFIAYGRTERPVFFGAPDGEGTRHFFLICTTDQSSHLHVLAHLAMLAHGTDLVEELETVTDAEGVIAAIAKYEREFS